MKYFVFAYLAVTTVAWTVPGWGMYGSLILAIICILILSGNVPPVWNSLAFTGVTSSLISMLFRTPAAEELSPRSFVLALVVMALCIMAFAHIPIRRRLGEFWTAEETIRNTFYRTVIQTMGIGGMLIATLGRPIWLSAATSFAIVLVGVWTALRLMGKTTPAG